MFNNINIKTSWYELFPKIIHMNLAVKFNSLKDTQPHYNYKPESCLENDNYKLYFDRTVLTDIHIKLELSVAMRNLWCGGDFTTYNFSNGNSTYYLRLKYLHNLLAHSVHKFCWNQTLPNQNYLLNKIWMKCIQWFQLKKNFSNGATSCRT
jgi:hypothetical protein